MPEHHSQKGVPDLCTKTNKEVSQVKAGLADLVSTDCPSEYQLREVPVRRENDPPKKHVLTRDQVFSPSCYSSYVTISVLHLLVGRPVHPKGAKQLLQITRAIDLPAKGTSPPDSRHPGLCSQSLSPGGRGGEQGS